MIPILLPAGYENYQPDPSVKRQVRSVNTRPPFGIPQIDWSNPISKGLLSLIAGSCRMDVVNGKNISYATSNMSKAITQHGLGFRTTSAGYAGLVCNTAIPLEKIQSGCTILTFDLSPAYGGYPSNRSGLFSAQDTLNQYMSSGTQNSDYMLSANGTTSVSSYYTPSSTTEFVKRVVVFDGSALRMYVDGEQRIGPVAFGLTSPNYYLAAPHGAGYTASGYRGILTCAWGRALSDIEIKSLQHNIWQILLPSSQISLAPSLLSKVLQYWI